MPSRGLRLEAYDVDSMKTLILVFLGLSACSQSVLADDSLNRDAIPQPVSMAISNNMMSVSMVVDEPICFVEVILVTEYDADFEFFECAKFRFSLNLDKGTLELKDREPFGRVGGHL